jgi:hypothetical protein
MRELWLGSTEGDGQSLTEPITLPSLNIRGMASARVGAEASNVIPATATASNRHQARDRDGSAADRRSGRRSHPQARILRGGQAGDAGDSPCALARDLGGSWTQRPRRGWHSSGSADFIRVEQVRGSTVKLPNMGGNLLLANIERPLGTRTIIVPIGSHDNNQHSFQTVARAHTQRVTPQCFPIDCGVDRNTLGDISGVIA